MKNIPTTKQYVSNSSSTLISILYNCIKPPSSPKCCSCINEETQRQLQRKQGNDYFLILDRHVDVFVCTFCKKLDQPKCTYCWDSKSCCNHREKTNVEDYFKTIKQEIIKTAHSIVETYKGYQKLSTDDLSFSVGPHMSPQSIKKDLTIHFYNIQDKLKKDVEEQITKNYQQLYEVYQTFEADLKSRLNPQSIAKNGDVLRKDTKQMGFGLMEKKLNISLQDCLKWLNELENRREDIIKMGQGVCEKYIERMNVDYPKILFSRLMQAFRLVLLPKVTFKDAMIQTVSQTIGSLNSIGSQKSIKQKRQENAGPTASDEKIEKLQRVIQKDMESMGRLEQRVKELEFILNIEQEKNQQLQVRVLELQAQCGISHDDRDISMIEKPFGSKLNQNRSYDFKSSLKSSRSNPNLLNQTEIIAAQERELESGKTNHCQNNVKSNKEQKPEVQAEPKNVKYRKKSTQSKMTKGKKQNSAWLEQVVNEIKQ